jgi:hypothetical protein
MAKSLRRLEVFGLAEWRPNGDYAQRRAVPALTHHQTQRLPQPARNIHYQAMQARRAGNGR